MKATVHNIRREQAQPGDVYIGRKNAEVHVNGKPMLGYTGYFGNPFVMTNESQRSQVIADFETYARRRVVDDPVYRERVRDLHGKRLFCFCAPHACHGDVLAQLADELAYLSADTADPE